MAQDKKIKATTKKRKAPKKAAKKAAKKKRGLAPKCFVISPFGLFFDDYHEELFVPAIEEAGFQPTRADDLYRPGSIIHDIWAYIREAKLLLADLTGRNPNVLYELGLAHAIGKPVIMITQSLDDVPFDLRNLRTIVYDHRVPNWGDILKSQITQAIKETAAAPTLAVPPVFLKENKEDSGLKIDPTQRQLLELRQEVNALRSRVALSNSSRRIYSGPNEDEILRRRVRNYFDAGMPPEEIVKRTAGVRFPVLAVLKELEKLAAIRNIRVRSDLTSQDDGADSGATK